MYCPFKAGSADVRPEALRPAVWQLAAVKNVKICFLWGFFCGFLQAQCGRVAWLRGLIHTFLDTYGQDHSKKIFLLLYSLISPYLPAFQSDVLDRFWSAGPNTSQLNPWNLLGLQVYLVEKHLNPAYVIFYVYERSKWPGSKNVLLWLIMD